MKPILTLSILLFAFVAHGQIIATTDGGGKKVILNMDGTWKYMDGSKPLADCATNQTGNLTIYNATSHDMYFYYAPDWSTSSGIKYVIVKANSSRPLQNLDSHAPQGNGGYVYKYIWVASYEILNYQSYTAINSYKGFEKGDFMITDCQNANVTVGQ